MTTIEPAILERLMKDPSRTLAHGIKVYGVVRDSGLEYSFRS